MRNFILPVVGLLLMGVVGCSPSTPKLIPRPEVVNDKVSTDSDSVVFNPRVDILFVVDNSGSMGQHQTNLSRNMDLFIKSFSTSIQIDYNVGVVTTDMSERAESGRLQGVVRIVNRSTPGALGEMSKNLKVGTTGDWIERSFDPVFAALTPPLVDGYNMGFLRRDAHLAVIFITDAEDQSSQHDANSLYTFLTALKGNKDRVLSYGVIVPSNVNNCERDEFKGPARIEQFLALTVNAGKNTMNLCDPDFGTKLADLSKDIAKYVGGVIYLNRAPVLSTLKVVYGTQEIPQGYKTGWVFDAARNAIILGEDIVWSQQPEGTKVQVYFEAAQFEEEKK